jgi:RNA polymerase sigma-70 factor, ECF subfamily
MWEKRGSELGSCVTRFYGALCRAPSRERGASPGGWSTGGVILEGLVDIGTCMDDTERRRRLERLFAEHSAAVRAYAERRIAHDVVDDVASDVFVVAWRRLEDVPEDALPWLLACARRIIANQSRSARRRAALRERLIDRQQPFSPGLTGPDPVLGQALATLSASDREVLMLVAWEGLRAGQAAVVIGCSQRAFAMRLHRARRRLAAAMAHLDPTWLDPMEAMQ